jgi:hypothetical protein
LALLYIDQNLLAQAQKCAEEALRIRRRLWETNQLASGFDFATSLMTQAHILGLRKGDCKDIVALAQEAQQVSSLEFIQRDAQELIDNCNHARLGMPKKVSSNWGCA